GPRRTSPTPRARRGAAVIDPAPLHARDRYERVTRGWVDNTHDDAFTHTVVLDDPDRALEVSVVALPSPTYSIRAARCRAVRGAVDPTVARGVGALAGDRLVAGLTRRAAQATGAGAGAGLALDGLDEAAPLPRHVAKLPPERAAR